jgi:hypothetical protein
MAGRRATTQLSCPTRHQPQTHGDMPLPAALHASRSRAAADSSACSYITVACRLRSTEQLMQPQIWTFGRAQAATRGIGYNFGFVCSRLMAA